MFFSILGIFRISMRIKTILHDERTSIFKQT